MCAHCLQTAWLEGFPDDVVVETRGRTTARPAILLLAKSVSLLPAPTRQERSRPVVKDLPLVIPPITSRVCGLPVARHVDTRDVARRER